MVSIIYKRLFNIRTEHTFYIDGISKDIELRPTRETVSAMKNNNMLFKMDNTGFRVLYKVDDLGFPFIDFKNVKLVFGVHIKNVNQFSNITTWATLPGYAPDKVPYFTNIGTETTPGLVLSFLDFLKPAVFNYQFPETGTTGETAKIEIFRNGANVTPSAPPDPNAVPVDGNGNFNFPIDFSNMPKGLYEFKTKKNPSGTITTKTVYIDTELVMQNIFAIVDILAKDATDNNWPQYPTAPPSAYYRTYRMAFDRRLTQWKYIIIYKSPSVTPPPPNTPAVKIEDDSNPVQPEYGTLVFNYDSDTTVNGLPAQVFLSDPDMPTIPYFEQAKYGLTIKKDPSLDILLSNIAGPPLGLTSADPTDFDITEIYVTI